MHGDQEDEYWAAQEAAEEDKYCAALEQAQQEATMRAAEEAERERREEEAFWDRYWDRRYAEHAEALAK